MKFHLHRLRRASLYSIRPWMLLSVVAALLGVAACADRVLHRPYSRDWEFDKRSAKVIHVVDGDTLDVDFDDPEPPVRVRLLGVDSPELDTPFGDAAKEYASARCGARRVTIRLDQLQGTRDKYGRLLAYVYLPNHELLNNSLIRDGHAFAYRPKRCEFSTQFETSENQARSAKRGMWKTLRFEEMPAWRQQWMRERGLK